MKITQKDFDKPLREFPCLMKSENNLIILCLDRKDSDYLIGVTLLPSSDFEQGYYCDKWIASCFTKYNGIITLENE